MKKYLFIIISIFTTLFSTQLLLANETSGLEITEDEKESIKNEIDDIQDKELEKSIVNLGASIKREDKL